MQILMVQIGINVIFKFVYLSVVSALLRGACESAFVHHFFCSIIGVKLPSFMQTRLLQECVNVSQAVALGYIPRLSMPSYLQNRFTLLLGLRTSFSCYIFHFHESSKANAVMNACVRLNLIQTKKSQFISNYESMNLEHA